MAIYTVAFQVFATTWVEVEADSEEEAREKVEQEAYEPSLCWQCASEVEVDALGDIVSVEKKGD